MEEAILARYLTQIRYSLKFNLSHISLSHTTFMGNSQICRRFVGAVPNIISKIFLNKISVENICRRFVGQDFFMRLKNI